ncbi:glioma tumor suppressor candidate region 2 protein [Alligator mississippiensis]|uniref:Ribosome biogenesis protein NOP53 n=1 Tax=Alligator mississippiensis TaxID=8496 RepID=A0A151MYY4_ALLMI|nr:glioma tumor suppressor candidate region 2 protein [Alligator mississippiensis]
MAAPRATARGGAARASGFLGLRPGARDPADAARPRNRGSRSRKKGWKRWRGPEAALGRELDAFLHDVSAQQRLAGGLVAEKPDESLFFVDTGNDEEAPEPAPRRGREKPLRIDLILQPDSKVPAPKDILSHQVPNGKKLKRKQRLWAALAERGTVPRAQRLLQARRQAAPPPAQPPAEIGRVDPARGFYDLWSDSNPLDSAVEGQEPWFLEQTKKLRVKRPARLCKKPSTLPAVEVVAPGASYNPSFQAHQTLLLQAHETELKRQKAEERLERQLRFPTAAEAPTQESAFQEQCEGLLEESGDEGGEELPQGEPEAPAISPALALASALPRGKKTEQQRKREKEAKNLVSGIGKSRDSLGSFPSVPPCWRVMSWASLSPGSFQIGGGGSHPREPAGLSWVAPGGGGHGT